MINESQPLDGPAEITRFGNPWHGLVQGGVLTLPAGGSVATKTWAQPQSAPSRDQVVVLCNAPGPNDVAGVANGYVASSTMLEPDLAGFTHALSPSNAPPVPLPADVPTTVDAAKQWRRSALLSGAKQQLYGQDLDGWIWCNAPGTRKLVKLTIPSGPVDMTTSLTLTATRENFGINVTTGVETINATLTDWRQYGAGDPLLTRHIDALNFLNNNGNCRNCDACTPAPAVPNPVYKQCRLTLYAISPTGDRALIEVSPATRAGTFEFTRENYQLGRQSPFICRQPIGWLLVTLTTGGMTVSAILSRNETFGVVGANTWGGYKLMGFFRPDGEIGWMSWSGSTLSGNIFTRITRLNSTLAPTADYIEMTAASGSAFSQFSPGFLIESDPIVSFYGPDLAIRNFRIGNGAMGFIHGSNGLNMTSGYANTIHTQVITPMGVKTIPAQTATWTGNIDGPNLIIGPRFSSYNAVTDEVSPLFQTSPVCWV